MSDLLSQFNGAVLVSAQIFYFKPRGLDQGPLEIPAEFIGQKAHKINHSGIVQEFFWQSYDHNDLDAAAWAKFKKQQIEFKHSLSMPDGDERLRDMFAQANAVDANEETKAMMAILQGRTPEDMPFVPDRSELSADETLRAMVPYTKLRGFLEFWQRELDGPLHSVVYSARQEVGATGYGAKHEFTLN
jgi:uncharacterized protein Usg